MNVHIVLIINGRDVNERVIEVYEPGDLEKGFAEACKQFRQDDPNVQLFGNGVEISIRRI